MTKVMATLALALLLQDAPKATITPGDPADKGWPVSGTAELPNDSQVVAAARRAERRWDEATQKFFETVADAKRLYGSGVVSDKRYSAVLKAGPAGMYQLTVMPKDQGTLLVETRACMGRPDRLFAATRERMRKIIEIIEKAEGYLKEIVRYHTKEVVPSPKLREDYLARLQKQENLVEDLEQETDLTATLHILKVEVYFHLRNAQVWSTGKKPADGGIYEAEGVFLNPDVTLGTIDKRLRAIRSILSKELRLSIAGMTESVFERAGDDAKRLAKVRDPHLKEAAKLAVEAPEADEVFVKALEELQNPKDEAQAAAARAVLKAVVEGFLRPG